MPKLTPVSWNELVRRLRVLGFQGPFRGGKHPFMIRDQLTLTIPNPHHGEIGIDLLVRVLRQAQVDRNAWITIR